MVKNPIGNGGVGTKTSTQQSALRAAETLTKMRLGYPLQKLYTRFHLPLTAQTMELKNG
jgi:hypothetical protein